MKRRCIFLAGITLLLLPLLGWWKGLYSVPDYKGALSVLCDLFTLPALSFLLVGGLVRCNAGGAFFAISYGVKCVLASVRGKRIEDYYDYCKRRENITTNALPFFLVGGGYLFVAALFLLAFYLL